MPEAITVRPADLLIDEENPRLSQPNVGQRKAMQGLAARLGKKLPTLAADIVKYGLNPSDLSIVIPSEDGFDRSIVLEGNRRLGAVKALENPEAVTDVVSPSILKRLRSLSKEYLSNPVEGMPCVEMADREEARHWIELRHTGENGGAGTVPWGADESARYKSRWGERQLDVYQQALHFLEARRALSATTRRQLPVTSFKRLIDTPEIRDRVGIEVQDKTLHLRAAQSNVTKALMYIVNDLASGRTTVKDIYRKADRPRVCGHPILPRVLGPHNCHRHGRDYRRPGSPHLKPDA